MAGSGGPCFETPGFPKGFRVYRGYIVVIEGLYWDNRKENGSYH